MNEQSTNSIETESSEVDEFNKPEQFCFSVEEVEESEGAPYVTICPITYFQENGYQDDQYYSDIARFLEEHDFYAVMEYTFVNDGKKMTKKEVEAKFLELGFKQLPEYDEYIKETESSYTFETTEPASTESLEEILEEEEEPDGGER